MGKVVILTVDGGGIKWIIPAYLQTEMDMLILLEDGNSPAMSGIPMCLRSFTPCPMVGIPFIEILKLPCYLAILSVCNM